jgi:GTP-binding protein
MLIRSAIFVTSAAELKGCPRPTLPEFAFIGRSNVGKSSLLNMISGRKHLAKTSATPGKTQLINFFLVNENFYLVDLPGYGFAKTAKDVRAILEGRIQEYCMKRDSLRCLFVLLDSRHKLQQIDREFLEWCGEKKIPYSIILTKCDKLTAKELKKCASDMENEFLRFLDEPPNIFESSAVSKMGRDEVMDFMDHVVREERADREKKKKES